MQKKADFIKYKAIAEEINHAPLLDKIQAQVHGFLCRKFYKVLLMYTHTHTHTPCFK